MHTQHGRVRRGGCIRRVRVEDHLHARGVIEDKDPICRGVEADKTSATGVQLIEERLDGTRQLAE